MVWFRRGKVPGVKRRQASGGAQSSCLTPKMTTERAKDTKRQRLTFDDDEEEEIKEKVSL